MSSEAVEPSRQGRDVQLGEQLAELLARYQRWFIVTGAGCSTASGIPAYRDALGQWKHKPPMQLQEFVGSEHARQRYWARSFVGWPRMAAAEPNDTHRSLAQLEALSRVHLLVTQNVDGLHDKAGSRNVLALHGRLSEVQCLQCGEHTERAALQDRLRRLNAPLGLEEVPVRAAPDGDSYLSPDSVQSFVVPGCEQCGGVLKPAVTFFGETVVPQRVQRAYAMLATAEAVLVVGSSLAVFSGYRFVKRAAGNGLPIAVVNQGQTRAAPLARWNLQGDCQAVLRAAMGGLAGSGQ